MGLTTPFAMTLEKSRLPFADIPFTTNEGKGSIMSKTNNQNESLFPQEKRRRKYPGVPGRRPDLASFRQKEAVQRRMQYDKLSPEEKAAINPKKALRTRISKGSK
jgi:hypothetical protein